MWLNPPPAVRHVRNGLVAIFGLAQVLTGLAGYDMGRLPADAARGGHGVLTGQIAFGVVVVLIAIFDWWWMRRRARSGSR